MELARACAAMGAMGDPGEPGEIVLTGVCTDSRLVRRGDLFVCLPGENFDGHSFAAKAVKMGAAAVLASRPVPDAEGSAPVLMVPDPLVALGRLAACWREESKAVVVAVTGSAGKTTVKEMLASILSQVGPTAKNFKNFNNQLGVPLTILNCTGQERWWILELGISLPHDMGELGAVARPDLAVVVNVGPAHLEGLGDLAGVARAKASLLSWLAPGGRGLASADYPELVRAVRETGVETDWFTCGDEKSGYSAAYKGPDGRGGSRFSLNLTGQAMELSLPVGGAYWAENVAAAAGAAHMLGAGEEAIRAGLENFDLPEHRSQRRQAGDWTIVDDAYNANPLSMRSAVQAAAELAGDRSLVLVLGDMRELGAQAVDEHRALGRFVAGTTVRAVYFQGEHALDVAAGLDGEAWTGRFIAVDGPADFRTAWEEAGLEGGVVLVKGSRSCRMEKYVTALAQMPDGGAD